MDVSTVLGGHRQMYHVKSGGVELVINHLPSREIVGVVRLEALLDYPPKFR